MNKEDLQKILEEHQKWARGEGGNRANLSGANLREANLREADLREANLSGADLREANLSGANLSGANLSGAYLRGADLSGAYLSGAYLREADLSGANLREADLSGANLREADLRGADLSGANLRGANLREAYLRGAYLRGANLRGANLREADLSGANLKNTILELINWLLYIGITPDENGVAYAYKITNKEGEGKFQGGINYTKKKNFEVEVDADVYAHCSYGINLATFRWCLEAKVFNDERLFLFKFDVKDAVCPVASDGKFRVKKCVKVGECDWSGSLKK